jgi:uncharacterized membrane protein YhaH (DUF805 family)
MYRRVFLVGVACTIIAVAIILVLQILEFTSGPTTNEALLRTTAAIALLTAVALALVWLGRRARTDR